MTLLCKYRKAFMLYSLTSALCDILLFQNSNYYSKGVDFINYHLTKQLQYNFFNLAPMGTNRCQITRNSRLSESNYILQPVLSEDALVSYLIINGLRFFNYHGPSHKCSFRIHCCKLLTQHPPLFQCLPLEKAHHTFT